MKKIEEALARTHPDNLKYVKWFCYLISLLRWIGKPAHVLAIVVLVAGMMLTHADWDWFMTWFSVVWTYHMLLLLFR